MRSHNGQAGPAGTPPCPCDLRPGTQASGQRASRRGTAIAALCMLAAAVALGSPVPLLGQEGDAPTPGQNGERIDALSERVSALEGGDGRGAWDWASAWPAVVAVVALLEVVHRVIRAVLGRARPALSWVESGEGLKFLLGAMPDGSTRLAIRVTNVGQAAAVDVVAYVGTRVSAHAGGRVRHGAHPHPMGSIGPGDSAQVPVPLSVTEHERVMGGETVTFEAELLYKDMGNRTYVYVVTGMYSTRLEYLEGAVTKALPARSRRRGSRAPAERRGRRAARK